MPVQLLIFSFQTCYEEIDAANEAKFINSEPGSCAPPRILCGGRRSGAGFSPPSTHGNDSLVFGAVKDTGSEPGVWGGGILTPIFSVVPEKDPPQGWSEGQEGRGRLQLGVGGEIL